MISDAALQEFKKIWVEEFGEPISDSEAVKLATNLLTIFNHVYRPLKKSWLAEVSEEEKHNKT